MPGEENRFLHLPRGVAVVIAPWNFPLAILTGMTAAALVTGNTVMMKPAEQSSVVGCPADGYLSRTRISAGRGELSARTGRRGGPALVEHPDVA